MSKLYTYALCEDSRIALLQHLLELLICGGSAGDLQLSLYSSFATLSVICLRPIIFGHHFDEFSRERRMLRLAYPQIGTGFVRLFLLLDVLFDALEFGAHFIGSFLNVRHQVLELLFCFCGNEQKKIEFRYLLFFIGNY